MRPYPQPYEQASHENVAQDRWGPISWMGSLITGSRDGTGQHYMRNRYYDPNTGRFTQEDPIRLAGGLNLYGFANGAEGLIQEQFNDRMNNPDYYQIEAPSSNRSHRYEQKP